MNLDHFMMTRGGCNNARTDLVAFFRGPNRREKSSISNNPNELSLAPRTPTESPRNHQQPKETWSSFLKIRQASNLILKVGSLEMLFKNSSSPLHNFVHLVIFPNSPLHIMASYVKNVALVGVGSQNKTKELGLHHNRRAD